MDNELPLDGDDGGGEPAADGLLANTLELTPAQRAMFDSAQKLARTMANKRMRGLPASIEFDDVMQAALIGLTQACQRFDAHREGANFEAYASIRIKGAMINLLRSTSVMTRSNVAFQGLVKKATSKLLSSKLDKVTDAELAAELGMSPEAYIKKHDELARNADMAHTSSLSFDNGDDGDGPRTVDIPDPSSDAATLIEKRERIEEFSRFLGACFTERERVMFEMFHEGQTTDEIGETFKVTGSRVSQITNAMLDRIQRHMASRFDEAPTMPASVARATLSAALSKERQLPSPAAKEHSQPPSMIAAPLSVEPQSVRPMDNEQPRKPLNDPLPAGVESVQPSLQKNLSKTRLARLAEINRVEAKRAQRIQREMDHVQARKPLDDTLMKVSSTTRWG